MKKMKRENTDRTAFICCFPTKLLFLLCIKGSLAAFSDLDASFDDLDLCVSSLTE